MKNTNCIHFITQIKINEKKAELLTATKKNGGRSANRNIVQIINIGEYRQFSVPKPPLLLAANRQSVKKPTFSSLSI